MLILSRRPGESFVIDAAEGAIKVHVMKINGRQISLGIDAPKVVPIRRTELPNRPKRIAL